MIKTWTSLLFVTVFSFSVSSLAQSSDVANLKQQLLMLAKSTTALAPKPLEVRSELEKLALQMQSSAGPVTEALWTQHAPGSWRQVWSDERDNSPPGSPALDLNNVYQYVRNDGRAVNFGMRLLPNGRNVTFALEASASIKDNVQTTTIVKGFARNSGLLSGELLKIMGDDILSGTSVSFQPLNLPQFPRGPIGATSALNFIYVDESLKVGTAPNTFTGDSELFIVERVGSVN